MMQPTDEFAKLLVKWFRKHGRNYPWRKNLEPYRVLIAEIMLQRTKADQVVPTYLSFLNKFPTTRALAKAPIEDIEKFFGALGLMWRAKKVEELAEALVSKYDGKIPDSKEELLSLPGVGEYVADAVLCFAHGRNVAVVDANVCRVIGRFSGLIARGEARRDPRFREMADRLAPKENMREYNWALIDFAASVCTPRNPKCGECPLAKLCAFAQKNR